MFPARFVLGQLFLAVMIWCSICLEQAYPAATSAPLGIPACGVTSKPRFRRVVGGTPAARCQLPWLVFLSRDNMGGDPCGGTLVSDRHIITAAHCLAFPLGTKPTLTLGEYKRNERVDGKFKTIAYTATLHPGFNTSDYRNDIAVLTLDTPVTFSDYECLHPICLPPADRDLPVGTVCSVAGWGSTSKTFLVKLSNILLTAKVSVVAQDRCYNIYRDDFSHDGQICAGDLAGEADSCEGDSGGPLMCRKVDSTDSMDAQYLLGVISLGPKPCAIKNVPALYSDVRHFREWLDSVMKPDVGS